MKCCPNSPFDMTTSMIPARERNIPAMFTALIFSLKKIRPAPIENIGIVAITSALKVGEPVSLTPYDSHRKYMNGFVIQCMWFMEVFRWQKSREKI